MARPMKPLVRGGGYYPSNGWTPLVYAGGYTTANGGGEPEPPPIEKTITGNPIHILDALAKPVQALSVKLEPIQAGSGDPSPDNVRPINGWTGANVTRTGDNIAPTVGWRVGGITASGQTSSAVHYAMYSPFIPCEPETTYYFTVTGNGFKKRLCAYETDQSNPMASTRGTITEDKTATITTGANDRFLRLAVESIDQTVELSFADFTPVVAGAGDTYSITFPTSAGTVYGGTLDVTSGKLTVDRAGALLNDPDKWMRASSGQTINFYYDSRFLDRKIFADSYAGLTCSYLQVYKNAPTTARWQGASLFIFGLKDASLTLEQVKADAASGKISILYPLATPIVYDLTPTEVTLLLGENNIWSDGEMTLTYLADGNASDEEALNILLGWRYVNNHTEDEPTDREALDIVLGGNK